MRIDAELISRRWHQLPKSNRANRTEGRGAIGAFNLNVGLKQDLPVRNAQARAAQGIVPAVSLGGFLNGSEDFRARNGATWSSAWR